MCAWVPLCGSFVILQLSACVSVWPAAAWQVLQAALLLSGSPPAAAALLIRPAPAALPDKPAERSIASRRAATWLMHSILPFTFP